VAGALLDDLGVVSVGALRAGVNRVPGEGDGLRQRNARLGAVDPEIPACAGGIPVQLIEVAKKPICREVRYLMA